MPFKDTKLDPKIILIAIAVLIFLSLIKGSWWLLIALIYFLIFFLKRNKIDLSQFNKSKIININLKNNMQKIIDVTPDLGLKKIIMIVVGAIILLWLAFSSIIMIDAGNTGVYTLFGKVKDREISSGLHVINPLAKIYEISVRTEEYTMSKSINEGKKVGDDSIRALTKEGLSVDLDITVLYHLNEQMASDIYKTLGLNYAEKIIRPEIRAAIREIIARYEAKDIYSEKRQEAGQEIYSYLNNKILSRGIIIEDVLIRNVELPSDLAGAIQEKLRAEQESQKYEFILDKEKKEAERKIIEAQGQRDAQKIINESLTKEYLNYLYIKELKDRPGTIYVPTSPSTGMPLFKEVGN